MQRIFSLHLKSSHYLPIHFGPPGSLILISLLPKVFPFLSLSLHSFVLTKIFWLINHFSLLRDTGDCLLSSLQAKPGNKMKSCWWIVNIFFLKCNLGYFRRKIVYKLLKVLNFPFLSMENNEGDTKSAKVETNIENTQFVVANNNSQECYHSKTQHR